MKQKEIWLVNLDPTVGAEIKKTRPCVVLNNDDIGVLPLKIVAPITKYKDNFSGADWMVKLKPDDENNLDEISVIDLFQVRSVSEKRLVMKLGIISVDSLEKIKNAIKVVFDID